MCHADCHNAGVVRFCLASPQPKGLDVIMKGKFRINRENDGLESGRFGHTSLFLLLKGTYRLLRMARVGISFELPWVLVKHNWRL